jgi:16S rRNA (cytidine1402-2'-O)-methyltransferase
LFYGFLPKTANELEKVLSSLSKNEYTQIFFVPSKKINFYIQGFKKFFSGRKILIAKEITKIHEAFLRENVDNLKTFKNHIKGELTIVVSENFIKVRKFDEEKIVNKVKKYLKKYSLKDTVNLIVETEKLNKKKVYELCLKIKNENNY